METYLRGNGGRVAEKGRNERKILLPSRSASCTEVVVAAEAPPFAWRGCCESYPFLAVAAARIKPAANFADLREYAKELL
jgi:hypothetical protein